MTLDLIAFGPPSLTLDGGPVAQELTWRKHLALFIYLAASPEGTRRRDHLVGLLWPDKDEAKARHSLNEACRAIRRGAGEAALRTQGDAVALDLSCLRADWTEADAALAAGDADRASLLWRGEFLEGFGIPDATPFEDWAAAERVRWRGRFREALTASAEQRAARGDVPGALALASRVLARDPSAEGAARLAMTCEALSGAAPAALARYEAYAAWLAREHGAEPAADLAALAVRIRAGRRAAAAPAGEPQATLPPLVGRGDALAALLALLPAPAGARVALVTGGPGHGRSRLLREVAERARLAGTRVVSLACVAADADQPGAVLRDLLRRGLADLAGFVAAPPDALALLAALEPAMAQRYPGIAPRAAQGAADLGRAFGEALAAAAAEAAVLVAVDDAHLADDLTLEALPAVLRSASDAPVTLLLSARFDADTPAPLSALRARIGHDAAGGEVAAAPLDDAAVAALVAALLPAYDAAARDRLVRRLRREAAGVPLFLIEILRALAGGGEAAGLWPLAGETTAQPLPFPVPGAVTAALTLRIHALPAPERETLLAAAVAGPRVDTALVAAMREAADADIEAHAAALERGGFLRHDGAHYHFAAEMVRTFVTAQMLAGGERRRLHERAATVLAARPAPETTLGLAEHLYGAGAWQPAAAAARDVRRAAARRGAVRLALRAERLERRAVERAGRDAE